MTLTREQREARAAKRYADNKRKARWRQKRLRDGLQRVEVYVRHEHAEAVRKFARETQHCSVGVP